MEFPARQRSSNSNVINRQVGVVVMVMVGVVLWLDTLPTQLTTKAVNIKPNRLSTSLVHNDQFLHQDQQQQQDQLQHQHQHQDHHQQQQQRQQHYLRVRAINPNNKTTYMYTLVIAIGVAPGYFERRATLRSTWLSWVATAPDHDVVYKFFTEIPVNGSRGYTETIEAELRAEALLHDDIVFQNLPSGYNTGNAERELYHIQHMLATYDFKYFLRVDDDGFLCLPQLLKELKTFMPPSVIHGKYRCAYHLARMDENYLLMSRDVCLVLAEGFATRQLPFGATLTFAINLGNVAPMLQKEGVHIFDDQKRICWPEGKGGMCKDVFRQVWLGNSSKRPGQFCDNFIWSHWVKKDSDFRAIYELQINSSATLTRAELQQNEEARVHRGLSLLNRSVCDNCTRFASGIPFYSNPATVSTTGGHEIGVGIPGMLPLANNPDLLAAISANVSRLFKKYRISN